MKEVVRMVPTKSQAPASSHKVNVGLACAGKASWSAEYRSSQQVQRKTRLSS
ncbi:predicted protein [Chaetomium globosum CBS 148.51]|uniref:Uncharacterized protein n=1 Tax=Chaetomium globosum (strain ATCC 6205 / CBS 148.51 / DSM 1962 / NBRC 6347 / NRRL 1970) TaxID=306901 RepID=Q2HB01_CHAGB|nr:uncharacterized protein CHGG_02603 [Chaetomium globosum CBS 148.51]EAQ90668.1 predicted protein [Chaetomium globosum CBS 148.51]